MKYLQNAFRTGLLPVVAALGLAGCGGGGGGTAATASTGALLASSSTSAVPVTTASPAGSTTTPPSTASATTPSSSSTTSSSTASTAPATTSSTSPGSCVAPNYGTTSGPLTVVTHSCPAGTQGQAYAGCTIQATGGTPPYTFSVDNSGSSPPLPEGMQLASCNGQVTAQIVGGQGYYAPKIIVTDASGAQATQSIPFEIAGNNAFLAGIFPSNSIFHTNISALPVDTSPAAAIYSGYQSAHIRVFFGNSSNAPFPNGIPAIEVPADQASVPVSTTLYQSYFTEAPIPTYAPVEGTSVSNGDRHVLVWRQGAGNQTPSLYEMWVGISEGNSGWTDSSNAFWPDTTSNALTPQDNGTSDAAGLPVGPLLVNADEVIGSGTPSSPNGTIRHPIRFTLNHMLNYWVWPATSTAGTGYCTNSSGQSIPVRQELSQSTPPASCSMTGPAGEIYRLKASIPNPTCAATSPQAAIIINAMRNYGIILADNGISGGLIGTPDSRWNDTDLACLGQLVLSDFEPVNVSSLMVSPNSGATQ